MGGEEVTACVPTRGAATAFQAMVLSSHLDWPRNQIASVPDRSPIWDHPEELETLKEYSFPGALGGGKNQSPLSQSQLQEFEARGVLLGLPILDAAELADVRVEFEELL